MKDIFGFDLLVDWPDLTKLVVRLLIDVAFVSVIVRAVYARLYKNREYVFTYYVFNVMTFCLCLLLRKVPAEIGFGLALFGVFGILRYRTEQVRIRDLTYLFVVIGVGMLNGIANKSVSLAELLAVNAVIAGLVVGLELGSLRSRDVATPMFYDRVELLRPEARAELEADLARRTGFIVSRVEVHSVDLLRDSAEVTVYHRVGKSRLAG